MKKFRFSSKNSDKSDPAKFGHVSIPYKDPIAIIPPKKVIKALYDYQVDDPDRNPGYLSFVQGDFLHVVGREDDTDWYDACNPLHNTRGLVPVNYFAPVDKTTRNSGNESGLPPQTNGANPPQPPLQPTASMNGAGERGSTGGKANSMVYGIVLFDFKAERPDELDAKAGEAIIVIAQSNPEWFVAKPITRLGGPGLIPVSFIEIRDTTTGKSVGDPQEAVRKAGVPKVEEWKRMAAEYKNSSVSLGRLNFGNAQTQSQSYNATQAQAMQHGMERLSVNSARRSQDGSRYGNDVQQYDRNSSGGYSQGQYYNQQTTRSMQLMSPVRARVPGYLQREGDFIFNVQALMEDGRAWNLQRSYKDFYGLQLHLIEQFPEAAGKYPGVSRTLPMMPGPLPWVTEKLTNDRCAHLNYYLYKLLKMTPITQSHVVRGFFYPKDFDMEIQPSEDLLHDYRVPEVILAQQDYRLSDVSQDSGQFVDSRQSSTGNLNGPSYASPQKNPQYQQQQYRSNSPSSQKQAANHYRSPSELRAMNGNGSMPPPMLRNNSAMTSASAHSGGSQQLGQPSNGAGASAAVKIKVWFGDSSCVVIRLPSTFNYADLVNKLRERWSLEPGVDKSSAQDVGFNIEYKDDTTQAYYRIFGDQELNFARDRNEKLTLKVGAVPGMM